MSRFQGLSAFERHKLIVNDYVKYYGGHEPATAAAPAPRCKTDTDILRENFQFLRDEARDQAQDSWEVRFAKIYYDRLFKEYALADLSRYRESKVGFRWRTEREVVAGRGQFSCGSIHCEEHRDLESFEVNFAYKEQNEVKQALVKVRLCPSCAYKLNYRAIKRLYQTLKRARREAERSGRGRERSRSPRRPRLDPDAAAAAEDVDTRTMRGGTLAQMVSSSRAVDPDLDRDEDEPEEGARAQLLATLVREGTVKVPRPAQGRGPEGDRPRAQDFFNADSVPGSGEDPEGSEADREGRMLGELLQ